MRIPGFSAGLTVASYFRLSAVATLLVDKGINPKAMDNSGRTPLLWAVKNRYEAVVKLLLDTGKADVD